MMIEIGNTISRQCGVLLPGMKWKHCLSGTALCTVGTRTPFPDSESGVLTDLDERCYVSNSIAQRFTATTNMLIKETPGNVNSHTPGDYTCLQGRHSFLYRG